VKRHQKTGPPGRQLSHTLTPRSRRVATLLPLLLSHHPRFNSLHSPNSPIPTPQSSLSTSLPLFQGFSFPPWPHASASSRRNASQIPDAACRTPRWPTHDMGGCHAKPLTHDADRSPPQAAPATPPPGSATPATPGPGTKHWAVSPFRGGPTGGSGWALAHPKPGPPRTPPGPPASAEDWASAVPTSTPDRSGGW
jgi:hypothetical protein